MSKKNKREKVRENGQIEQQDGEKDYKEILVEQYEKGLVPTITREQDFCFDCVQCGECCRNREDILLNPLDVFRLCRKLKLSAEEFIDKYGELYMGYSSKMPVLRIAYRAKYGINGISEGTRCPFLGSKDGIFYCRVHDSKPFVCRSFPLGRVRKNMEEEQYILQPDGTCKGRARAEKQQVYQNVEAWMGGKEKVDLQERYSAIFDQFLFDIRSWINLDKLADHQGGNSAEYASWFALVSFLMYGNYEFEKSDEEFLEMLQENICSIQKVCEETVEMCNGHINLRPRK